MKISIVRIGNSKGIILPKSIRELVGLLSDTADLSVEGNSIIISPTGRKYKNLSPVNSLKKTKRTPVSRSS